MHFTFIAGNHLDLNILNNIEDFVNNFPDFQTVELANEKELELLLELMNIREFISYELDNLHFYKYWDISGCKLPELDSEQFDTFYNDWLKKSNRKNTMDEYGNLIFLRGLTSKWNTLKFRLITRDIDY